MDRMVQISSISTNAGSKPAKASKSTPSAIDAR